MVGRRKKAMSGMEVGLTLCCCCCSYVKPVGGALRWRVYFSPEGSAGTKSVRRVCPGMRMPKIGCVGVGVGACICGWKDMDAAPDIMEGKASSVSILRSA